jgi:hypothetical protein
MTGATDDRGRATAGRGVPLSTADRSQNATDAQSCRMVRPAYKIKVNKLTVSALPSTSYIRPDETRELLDLTFHVSSHSVFLHLNQSLCIVRGCQNLAASARARPSSSCSRLRARSHTVSRKVRWEDGPAPSEDFIRRSRRHTDSVAREVGKSAPPLAALYPPPHEASVPGWAGHGRPLSIPRLLRDRRHHLRRCALDGVGGPPPSCHRLRAARGVPTSSVRVQTRHRCPLHHRHVL